MCLAVPVKVVELEGTQAVVDMNGVRRPVQTNLLPDLQVGDFVLVHAGFAIQKWSDEDVAEYQAIIREMDESEDAPDA